MRSDGSAYIGGGFGTRLQSVVNDVPKPMAPVNNKPFLSYLLDFLELQGVTDVVLCTGYKHEVIFDYFKYNYRNINIKYSVEEEPLGTGGAIAKGLKLIQTKDAIILNGDTFFNIDIREAMMLHKDSQADLTIALKPMKSFDRYGTVRTTENNRIVQFEEKKRVDRGNINGGVYILKKERFLERSWPKKFSFEQDFLEVYFNDWYFNAYISDTYFIDIGIPEDYLRFQKEQKDLL